MPANHTTDLISLENAAALAAMQSGYDRYVRQQADRLESRNRAIIEQYARGGKVQFISADYGLSQDRVRKIIAENGNPLPRKMEQPAGATQPALYRSDLSAVWAKNGSAALARAIMEYHLRQGSFPPQMAATEFIDRCHDLKIQPALIRTAIEKAVSAA
jgi:hypothetical protein